MSCNVLAEIHHRNVACEFVERKVWASAARERAEGTLEATLGSVVTRRSIAHLIGRTAGDENRCHWTWADRRDVHL
jgi:hypothetical protein